MIVRLPQKIDANTSLYEVFTASAPFIPRFPEFPTIMSDSSLSAPAAAAAAEEWTTVGSSVHARPHRKPSGAGRGRRGGSSSYVAFPSSAAAAFGKRGGGPGSAAASAPAPRAQNYDRRAFPEAAANAFSRKTGAFAAADRERDHARMHSFDPSAQLAFSRAGQMASQSRNTFPDSATAAFGNHRDDRGGAGANSHGFSEAAMSAFGKKKRETVSADDDMPLPVHLINHRSLAGHMLHTGLIDEPKQTYRKSALQRQREAAERKAVEKKPIRIDDAEMFPTLGGGAPVAAAAASKPKSSFADLVRARADADVAEEAERARKEAAEKARRAREARDLAMCRPVRRHFVSNTVRYNTADDDEEFDAPPEGGLEYDAYGRYAGAMGDYVEDAVPEMEPYSGETEEEEDEANY